MPQQILSIAQAQKLLTNLPAGATLEIKKTNRGDIIVNKSQTKEQLIAEKYAPLTGQGISISDAAKKYSVPRGAIQAWIYRNGYVDFIDSNSYPKLIDESQIAICSDVYHARQKSGLSGVPYFDEDNCLIEELKHPQLSEYRARKKAA